MLPNSKTKFYCCHLLFKKDSLAPHMGSCLLSISSSLAWDQKSEFVQRCKIKNWFFSSSWNNLLSISGCVVPCLTPFQLSKVNLLSIPAPISCYTRQIEEISQKSFRFLVHFVFPYLGELPGENSLSPFALFPKLIGTSKLRNRDPIGTQLFTK